MRLFIARAFYVAVCLVVCGIGLALACFASESWIAGLVGAVIFLYGIGGISLVKEIGRGSR